MTENSTLWLSDQPPTRDDHAAFAMDRVRGRKLEEAAQKLSSLSLAQLNFILAMPEENDA